MRYDERRDITTKQEIKENKEELKYNRDSAEKYLNNMDISFNDGSNLTLYGTYLKNNDPTAFNVFCSEFRKENGY